MKLLGFFIVTVGFLAGAYFLTGAGGDVLGFGFWISFVFTTIGVIVLRVMTRKRKGAIEKVTAEVNTVEQSIARLAAGVDRLEKEKKDVYVYDLPALIDARFNEDLARFVNGYVRTRSTCIGDKIHNCCPVHSITHSQNVYRVPS